MTEEFQEYVTFTVTSKDGIEVELAVVDEFEYKHKNYVAAALIEGDAVNEEAMYIYKVKAGEEEFAVEKITSAVEYEEIAKAYMAMDEA